MTWQNWKGKGQAYGLDEVQNPGSELWYLSICTLESKSKNKGTGVEGKVPTDKVDLHEFIKFKESNKAPPVKKPVILQNSFAALTAVHEENEEITLEDGTLVEVIEPKNVQTLPPHHLFWVIGGPHVREDSG